MTELGSQVVREEAEFIPAKMKKAVRIEHAYKCKKCKRDINEKAQIKKGRAPNAPFLGKNALAKAVGYTWKLKKG